MDTSDNEPTQQEAYTVIFGDSVEYCEDDIPDVDDPRDAMLITLVQSYPCIYDNTRVDFKNTIVKAEAWVEIAAAVGCTTVYEAQRDWVRLRTNYSRDLRKHPEKANPLLRFLHPFIRQRPRRCKYRNRVPVNEEILKKYRKLKQERYVPIVTPNPNEHQPVPSPVCSTNGRSLLKNRLTTDGETSRISLNTSSLSTQSPTRVKQVPAFKESNIEMSRELSFTAQNQVPCMTNENVSFGQSIAAVLDRMKRKKRNELKIKMMQLIADVDSDSD